MTKLHRILIPALLLAATAAQADIQKHIDYRQAMMNVYAWNITSMRDMVRGEVAFDAAAFARHAEELATAARLEILAAFPEDSINEDSDARDEIWLDWAKFESKQKALREESAKLAEVAASGDEGAIKAQFGATSKTCKGCHDDFKN